MRNLSGALPAVVPALLFVSVAIADQTQYPVKWSQPPNISEYPLGMYTSTDGWFIAADDFQCQSPSPVIGVHWWGGFWDETTTYPIDGFTIRFHDNHYQDGFYQPGAVLYQAYISGNCNETLYGGWPDNDQTLYQYDCLLPDPFEQETGEIYWLSIQADVPNTPPVWAWHISHDAWGGGAVQAGDYGYWPWDYLGEPAALAFELREVPEPTTLLLAVLGMASACFLRRRR